MTKNLKSDNQLFAPVHFSSFGIIRKRAFSLFFFFKFVCLFVLSGLNLCLIPNAVWAEVLSRAYVYQWYLDFEGVGSAEGSDSKVSQVANSFFSITSGLGMRRKWVKELTFIESASVIHESSGPFCNLCCLLGQVLFTLYTLQALGGSALCPSNTAYNMWQSCLKSYLLNGLPSSPCLLVDLSANTLQVYLFSSWLFPQEQGHCICLLCALTLSHKHNLKSTNHKMKTSLNLIASELKIIIQ